MRPKSENGPFFPLLGSSQNLFQPYAWKAERGFRSGRNPCLSGSDTIAAIILWNTTYLGHAVAELRAQAETLPDKLLAHIAPLGWEHISFNGDYVWPRG